MVCEICKVTFFSYSSCLSLSAHPWLCHWCSATQPAPHPLHNSGRNMQIVYKHCCFVHHLLVHPTLRGDFRLLTVRHLPSYSALLRAIGFKIKHVFQWHFYSFVKDLSLHQIFYKIPFQLCFISSLFLLEYFRSSLSLPSLTSPQTFYIVLDRLHFIACTLFFKEVDCETIPKRRTFFKVPPVMKNYHPLKRFN